MSKMEQGNYWMCELVYGKQTFNHVTIDSNITSNGNTQDSSLGLITSEGESEGSDHGWDFISVVTQIIMPTFCGFGLLGNLLNIVVLLKRVSQRICCISVCLSLCRSRNTLTLFHLNGVF